MSLPRLVLAISVVALNAVATAQQVKHELTAYATATGCFPNKPPGEHPYWNYEIGQVVHFQSIIDNPRLTPVVAGFVDFLVDDDYLLLICDPGSYVLPVGATLTLCDPGPGLPGNGRFRVDNIDVPAMAKVQIDLQVQMAPTTPKFRNLYALSRFVAPAVGTLWSNPQCCGSDPGIATAIVPIPPPPEWAPIPLQATLIASDRNGGPVLPGDTIDYLARVWWWPCGTSEQGMINAVAPLPAGVDFVGFTRCAPDLTCWYDPVVHRVFVDTTLPYVRLIDAEAEFEVVVRAGTQPGSRLCTQAVMNGNVLSDDPADGVPESATCVNVGGTGVPALAMFKTIREEGDDDGVLERGEWARFELSIYNYSLTAIDDVHVLDVLPVGLQIFDPLAVRVTPLVGTNRSVAAPAGLGAGVVEWSGIRVPGQSSVLVSFAAQVDPGFVGILCNRAELTSATWSLTVPSDDPSTVDPEDATCAPVVPPRLRDTAEELLGGCDMRAISAGRTHSLGARVDGKLAVWGDNANAQLGDGSRSPTTTPLQIPLASDVSAVAAGRYHSVAATVDGRVWAWGDNSWGQLGSGAFGDLLVPVEVMGLSGVTAVAAGYFHSLAMKSDGTVWAWGYNREGQLGDGTTTTSPQPVRVTGLASVVAIAAGAWHSLALDASGNLWSWGDNERGQLGLGTTIDSRVAQRIPTLSAVTKVASRSHHTIATRSNGTAWSWGWAELGQLGIGSVPSPVSTPTQIVGLPPFAADAVAAGVYHSLISIGGALFAWGDGVDGMLGNGGASPTSVPVASGMGLSGWSVLAAGDLHSLAIRPGDYLWSWGRNRDGQLGDGTTSNRLDPVWVDTTCAVRLEEDPLRPPAVDDSCAAGGGNADGYAEPGETIAFEPGIRNAGGLDATRAPAIQGILVGPPPPGVVFIQDTVGYLPTPLAGGASAAPDRPFVIELQPDVLCPQTITLPVDIVSDQGTFAIAITFDVGPCAVQCQAIDCQPLLQKVTLLKMVRTSTRVDATWTTEPSATSGYALWSVATKNLIPIANQATTTRTAECTTPDAAVVQCRGATPIGTTPSVLFYQVLGVCGVGLEGPL